MAGLMSAADKQKLDGIAVGAGDPTNLSVGSRTATTLAIVSSTGADATVPAASGTEAGLLVAADKTKLDGLDGTTTVGRLARYSGTAGQQSDTTGVFEDGSGNVGIGTTSPTSRLDVMDGLLSLSDPDISHPLTQFGWSALAYGRIGPISGTTGGLDIWGLSDTDAAALRFTGFLGSADPADTTPAVSFTAFKSNGGAGLSALGASETVLQFINQTIKLLTVLGNGNVGVGTIAPVTLLDVNGSIRAKTYVVSTLPAASLGAGQHAYVSDSTLDVAAALGEVVAGGGSDFVRVYSDGTNWRVG